MPQVGAAGIHSRGLANFAGFTSVKLLPDMIPIYAFENHTAMMHHLSCVLEKRNIAKADHRRNALRLDT